MPMNILKNSMALLYKKKGKDVVPRKDLELMIAMDLRWFTPKEAEALLDLALKSGILRKKKEGLEITFDLREFDIPIGFKPSPEVLETAAHQSCFVAIVDAIEKDTQKNRADIVAEINDKQDTLNVAIEVAALLVGASYEVDMSAFFDVVEKELISRFSQKST